MSPSAYAGRRAVRRAGTIVDLYLFEAAGETSRGTDYQPTADSPLQVKAIPDPGAKSLGFGIFGSEVDADMVWLVQDDVDEDRDVGLRDGGGEGASVLVDDGKAYRVIDADRHATHGAIVLECDRDQEVIDDL